MALREVTYDLELKPLAEEPDELDVSFFVPCYNEEEHVLQVIAKCDEAAGRLGLRHEILIFDDNSKDATVKVANDFRKANAARHVRVYTNTFNCGVARNFIEGAFVGRGKYYRLICGDDVESVDTIVQVLGRAGAADIIIPYHEGRIPGRSFFRFALSKLYTNLVNIVSGQKLRYYNGLPLYRRRDVLRYHVEATGSGYQAEFLLQLLREHRSFVQVPVDVMDRSGSTALNFRNFLSVGYSMFRIFAKRTFNAK